MSGDETITQLRLITGKARVVRDSGAAPTGAWPGGAPAVSTTRDRGPVSSASPGYPMNEVHLFSQPLTDAWQDFIARFPMNWFCTFTFTDSVHPERAGKLFRLFIRKLNRYLYGSHFERKGHAGVFYVLASEYQKRGVLHFHALIGDVEDLNARARRLDFMDLWLGFGPPAGIARIEEIKNQDAVRGYVTKYVTKGGQIELSPSLRSFAQQQPLSNPTR